MRVVACGIRHPCAHCSWLTLIPYLHLGDDFVPVIGYVRVWDKMTAALEDLDLPRPSEKAQEPAPPDRPEVIDDDLALIDALQQPIEQLDWQVHQRARSEPTVKALTQLPGVAASYQAVARRPWHEIATTAIARELLTPRLPSAHRRQQRQWARLAGANSHILMSRPCRAR